MSAMNWEKVNRDKRMTYTPSPRIQSMTEPQRRYIEGLAKQKAYKIKRMPTTKWGASELIERLKVMPDALVHTPKVVAVDFPKHSAVSTAEKFREKFDLSPTVAQAFVMLCERADPCGAEIFYDLVLSGEHELVYDDMEDLVAELMGSFWRWRNGDI